MPATPQALLDWRDLAAAHRAELQARFGIPGGARRLDRISWKPGPRRTKAVWRARSPAGHDLALKTDTDAARLAAEWDALEALRAALPDMPETVFHAPGRATYATVWLEGRNLLGRMPNPERLDDLAAAGRWLAAVQRATADGAAPLDPMPGLDHIRRRRARLGRRWKPFGPVFESLRAHAEALPGTPVPQSLVHGDFALQNLIATPDGRIVPLDAAATETGPILRDLVKLLFSLRLRRVRAARHDEPWPDDDGTNRRAVLRAWGGTEPGMAPVLRYLEDEQIVRAWVELRGLADRRDDRDEELADVTAMVRRRGLLP